MAAHWDRRDTRPLLPSHNSYHGQTTSFKPSLLETPDHTRPQVPPILEPHDRTTPFGPPLAENNLVPLAYYEGYTIRPDDLASSEERWSLPPKNSIPATQEDLHTEVIRQRQSGRTACRELEDCHGPKRQYIDRLISERNASTTLGHFEVAQLRLERIPRDSGKVSNRNSGRNHHARDYKQKDSIKTRQKTIYMHIILQFMRKSNRSLADIPPDNFAPRNPNGDNSRLSGRQHTSEEGIIIPSMSFNDQPSLMPGTSQRPILARGYPYTTGNEQSFLPRSSRYISRGTQTTFAAYIRPDSDCCSGDNSDDATLGGASAEDTWTTTTPVEEEMPSNSLASDDEVVSMGDSGVAHESAHDSIEKESRGVDEYEKPPWFQKLQPVKSPGIMDEQTDVSYQQDDGEASTMHEENDTDDACGQDNEEVLKAHREGDADYAQLNTSSLSGEEVGQSPPGDAANPTEHHDNDEPPNYAKNESTPIDAGVRKLDSIDEHPSTGPTTILKSEYLSNLPGPTPQKKLPPSERYKPRPPPDALPARPSLTRAPPTYDSRLTDDSERKSSKRVSFQQAPTPLYTPPSTTTSSPASPSASPQLPFRTILAKPPPVSIPPGQYTPIASSSPSESPVSPSPPITRKPYTCLEPSCDSSFDYPHDRDRHERQHEIGDPPYSRCPICHYSRSGDAAVNGAQREHLIAHMNRRH